tara:strand:+ start:829 stop:1059 length:231 start_codon:yes stop_codon:yes gene_type:complete
MQRLSLKPARKAAPAIKAGKTFAACAELLQTKYPNATIRIFAVMRTLGFVDEIETVFYPSAGRIVSHASGNPYREP